MPSFSGRPRPSAPPPPSSSTMLLLINDDDYNSHCIRFSDDNGDNTNAVATAKGLKKSKLSTCTRNITVKKQYDVKKPSQKSFPIQSGTLDESSEENMDEGICLESCTFNKLLLALGNGKKSLAAAYKKRQREQEGRSDSKEDDAGSSKYSDSYDSEKASPGPSDDYSGDEYEDEAKDGIVHDTGISGDEVELQNSCSDLESDSDLDNATTMKDESKCGDEVELQNSDSDFESDSDIDNATTMKDESKCSYLKHLEHVLTNAEVDSLQKRIWKYTWEMPAFGSSASKWKGTGECPFKLDEIDSFSGLKLKLYKNWLEFQAKSGGSDFHSSRQWHFYSLCRSYRDLLYGDKKPFYLKGDTDLSVMDAYILHTLNHIYRARTLVTKNANKLAKNPDRNEIEVLNGGCFLDRGFTRPKVLLLLPFRSIALRVVKRLIQLTPPPHKAKSLLFSSCS